MGRLFLLFNLLLVLQIGKAQSQVAPTLKNPIQTAGLKKHLLALASKEMQGRKAGAEGARKAASYILEEFRNIGLMAPDTTQQLFKFETDTIALEEVSKKNKVKIKERKNHVTAITANVIGFVPGAEYPNEFVILSAHYDHMGMAKNKIFFGADDNASGVSALLTIAEAFSEAAKAGSPPARTVVFIAFGAEEDGLIGSYFYTKHPVFPLEKTSANINIDMIGRKKASTYWSTDRKSMFVIGGDRLSPDWPLILKKVQEETHFALDETYGIRYDPEMLFLRSDQYHFAMKGVPALFFTNGTHKDYHLPSDVEAKIDYEALTKRANFIYKVARELADRSEMLERSK